MFPTVRDSSLKGRANVAKGAKPTSMSAFQRAEDKVTKTRALQVGAAWAGEKGQINVKLEVVASSDRRVLG